MIDLALPNTMTLLLRGLIIASLVLMSTAIIDCEEGTHKRVRTLPLLRPQSR